MKAIAIIIQLYYFLYQTYRYSHHLNQKNKSYPALFTGKDCTAQPISLAWPEELLPILRFKMKG